jgi:general nucleoside transport system permease protein
MYNLSRRKDMPLGQAMLIRSTGILLALITAGVLFLFLGYNPLEVFASMLKGSVGSGYNLRETIIRAIPLVVTSLGISLAFRMKFWNIGAEGQIIMGAFAATFFALFTPNLPRALLLPLMALAGMLAGGLWAFVTAVLKVKFGVNETIITLMMNYVALQWVTYLQYGPWRDPKALNFPKIANFGENAILPKILGIHSGWVIAIILAAVLYYFIRHTAFGYEINVVGESRNTARYAGIQVGQVVLATVFLSGALCGLTGMLQASAVSQTLTRDIAGGVGYTAIITAWLASLSAPLILVVSFFFAMLVQGGDYIQTAFNISASVAKILQAVILFFVLGSEFFVQYRIHRVSGEMGVR